MYDATAKTLHTIFPILALVIILLISGCQVAPNAQTDLFKADQSSVFGTQTLFLSQQAKPEVIGGLILNDYEQAAPLLEKIKNKASYSLVVVLGGTDYKDGQAYAFTYTDAGELAKDGITIDSAAASALVKTGLIKDLGKIGSSSRWSSRFTKALAKNFPRSKFIFVAVDNMMSPPALNLLAYALKTSLPADSLVLGLFSGKKSSNKKIVQFQGDFAKTVIDTFDVEKFDELPLDATSVARITALYLRYRGAGKIVAKDGDFMPQVLYGEGQAANNSSIFMVAFGDVMLGRFVRALMDRHGNDYPFSAMDTDYLRVNDLLLANLEGPIAKKTIQTLKAIAFRFPPDTAAVLKKYYFDVLSLANNHIYDMGQAGYDDTRLFLDSAGILNFGDPRDSGRASAIVTVTRGRRIAFLGLEDVVYKLDADKAVEEIRRLAGEGDLVIAVVHWGVEYTHQPTARQKELAHRFIDAGAFAVIGSHPHVVQAFEVYNNCPIFYSLGNAVFDQYWSSNTQVGLSVAIVMSDQQKEIYMIPIKNVKSQLQLMDDEEAAQFLAEMSEYSEGDDATKAALREGHITLTASQ